jgi:Family of unknown function (DUF6644)
MSSWILPVCESLHFIGMATLVGIVGVFDLRLLGMAKRLPVAPLQRLMPWALLGFAVSLGTGIVFITANPRQYLAPLSLSFIAKMFFILLACLNVFLFYATGLKRAADGVESGQDAPLGAKISAGVSLFLWVAVMYWGRVLQFFGKSF